MSKEQTPQLSLQELAIKNIVTEYNGSIEQYAVDNWIAGYAASQATVGQQVGCNCNTEEERWMCSKKCINKPKLVQSLTSPATVEKERGYTIHKSDGSMVSPATVAPPVSGDEIISKEEILKTHTGTVDGFHNLTQWHKGFIYKAMEEYANQFQPPVSGMNRETFKQKISVIISTTNTTGNEKRDAIMELYDQFLPQPPVSGDEIEKSFQWLAEVNANGVDNKEDHKIIICDGDYYWELDQDGDQPISPAKLSEMFLKRNSATPIKETVTDGVEFADWIVSSGYILSHYDPKNKIMYHHRLDGHKPITDVKYYYTAELYTLFQKSKTL